MPRHCQLYCTTMWEKRLKERKLQGGKEEKKPVKDEMQCLGEWDRGIVSGEAERVRQSREWVGVHCRRAASLIGCFAIRKLRDESKLALYSDPAQDGPGMLYKESQEVFLGTGEPLPQFLSERRNRSLTHTSPLAVAASLQPSLCCWVSASQCDV